MRSISGIKRLSGRLAEMRIDTEDWRHLRQRTTQIDDWHVQGNMLL